MNVRFSQEVTHHSEQPKVTESQKCFNIKLLRTKRQPKRKLVVQFLFASLPFNDSTSALNFDVTDSNASFCDLFSSVLEAFARFAVFWSSVPG